MLTKYSFVTFCSFLCAGLFKSPAQADAPEPAPDRTYKLFAKMKTGVFFKIKVFVTTSWDPIKYIPLQNGKKNWYLTLGGEAREVWEQIGNDNWGQSPF